MITFKNLLVLLLFSTISASCQTKEEQREKSNEIIKENLYSGTGKWEIVSYEYTSKTITPDYEVIKETQTFENAGTIEFKNGEGEILNRGKGTMYLEKNEHGNLIITSFKYHLEYYGIGEQNNLVLWYNRLPLVPSSGAYHYHKLSWKPNEFTIVFDYDRNFTKKYVCRKILE